MYGVCRRTEKEPSRTLKTNTRQQKLKNWCPRKQKEKQFKQKSNLPSVPCTAVIENDKKTVEEQSRQILGEK